MLADIALDTVEHDLTIEGFDLQLVTGVDRVAQQIKIRFLFFLGEWFLNVSLGVPYYRDILVKAPNRAVVEGLLREVIITTPNVVAVQDLTFDYDNVTRKLDVRFRADTDFGELEFAQTGMELPI